eukprot:SAG22_NODE_126_length_18820_cov_10.207788_4_plen_93_part_00
MLEHVEARAQVADESVGERNGAAECVLLPGRAETVVAEVPQQVPVENGTFAELDGRWGEIIEDRYPGAKHVDVRWLDDGSICTQIVIAICCM